MALTLAEKGEKARTRFLAGYEEHKKSGSTPEVFHNVNTASLEKFKTLGFYKKTDELFTYVGVNKIFDLDFGGDLFQRAIAGASTPKVTKADVERETFKGCEGSVIVFVDGWFDRDLSDLSALTGIVVAELENAAEEEESGICDYLEKSVEDETDRFAAINGAFLSGGVSIDIPSGVAVESTIQILHFNSGNNSMPRTYINLRPGAEAVIVERFVGASAHADVGAHAHAHARSFCNFVTDINLDSGSTLDLYSLQGSGYLLGKYRLTLAGQTAFNGIVAQPGGILSRNNFEAHLEGEGAELNIGGVAVIDGEDEAHNYLHVHHKAANCRSGQMFRNILKGSARASVDTTVEVHEGAQLTVSHQLVNNLMLSDKARVGGKPTLMIKADDVKCQHGATVGRIDDDQLFYLKTRGVSEQDARRLLIGSFANAIIEKIKFSPLREAAESLLLSKLGG
jgi:Fe-S cluster assembly protein SufD